MLKVNLMYNTNNNRDFLLETITDYTFIYCIDIFELICIVYWLSLYFLLLIFDSSNSELGNILEFCYLHFFLLETPIYVFWVCLTFIVYRMSTQVICF